MSRFSQAYVEELRGRIILSDIVGRKVKLHRRGRQATGLCPFHNEKSPSFHVYDEDGHYHCFGCNQHGDAIAFLMRMDGISFPDAVEKLAREAGMALPKADPIEEGRYRQKQDLYTIMEYAAKFFESQLNANEGRQARDYLKQRGSIRKL